MAMLGHLLIGLTGLAVIAHERCGEVVEMELRSIIAGTLATCPTASIVGLL